MRRRMKLYLETTIPNFLFATTPRRSRRSRGSSSSGSKSLLTNCSPPTWFSRSWTAPENRCAALCSRRWLIGQAISLTQPRWQTQAIAAGCEIVVAADLGEIPMVAGDPAELREVFTNMIFNAVDAMPEGGGITLCTRAEGGTVVLQISDTGTGMSEGVQRRCLEPFFTTKGSRGTGLGLAMVFGIIHRHGGVIDIASEVGKGTTFTLRLPATAVEGASNPAAVAAVPRPLHILVANTACRCAAH